LKWCQDIATAHGFVLIIIRLDEAVMGKKSRVTIGCEMSGKYKCSLKDEGEKKKSNMTASRKSQCPFTLKRMMLGSG
ncbi:MAG: hypothetical protein Q8736_02755, partial [Sweet potato little leaf phytoplasma]|nr:hypothetical protein [Sweet potato little leaf phytoplasma]